MVMMMMEVGLTQYAKWRIVSSFCRRLSPFVFRKHQRQANVLSSLLAKKYSDLHGFNLNCSTDEKLSFRSLLFKNIQQANRSVVVEISSHKTLFEAPKSIEESGNLKEIFHFTSKSGKEFIIAEFNDVGAVQNFLNRCRNLPEIGKVPTFSRILKCVDANPEKDNSKMFKASGHRTSIQTSQNCEVKDKTFTSVTEIIENTLEEEKLTDIESRLRYFVCTQISDAFRGLFSHCEVLPFGSSVNGLGTHFSDLDGVLVLYSKKELEGSGLYFPTKQTFDADYEQKILSTVAKMLNTFLVGIAHVEPVFRARVPVVKFYHELFELNCDLCVSNVSGLEMSELLYNCVSLDSRVRPLAFAIKKWAKMAMVTSDTRTHTVSNFSLFLLLVFFLQTRPSPILPPLCKMYEIKNCEGSLNPIINFKSSISNQETMGDLLKEFFNFIRSFNFGKYGISAYHGKITAKDYSPLFIENPLDKRLNVSLNVSKNSLPHLKQAANLAHNSLGAFSKSSSISDLQFWKALSSQHHTGAS